MFCLKLKKIHTLHSKLNNFLKVRVVLVRCNKLLYCEYCDAHLKYVPIFNYIHRVLEVDESLP